MAKVKWKGGTLLAPVPAVMVSCGDGQHDDIVTVAWTGIINSDPPKTYISLRPSRFSYGIIKETREFAINLVPASLVSAADSCGVYSGRNVDKFEKYRLEKEAANEISCPLIAQCPMALECRVTDIVPLGTHDMFIADIVAVDVDESLIDEKGKLHLERAKLSAYVHGDYYELGKRIGGFGFSVRKKSKKNRRK